MSRAHLTAIAAAAAAVVLVPFASPASAATVSSPIVSNLAGPLQMSVHGKAIFVSQNFAGVLTKVTRKARVNVATAPTGGEIAGVDVDRRGVVSYTTTTFAADGETAVAASLRRLLPNGKNYRVADLFAYEQRHNPDKHNSYGFQNLSASCAAQVPAQIGGGSYHGMRDTHPYAVASLPHGFTVVADAAGNDILLVSPRGRVHTLAVLPPTSIVVTAAAAAANMLPACTVGATFNLEPVPTDVEVGRHGKLYVTTLPGGPEDGSLGANGSVYRLNPWHCRPVRVATGFAGATNLAIGRHGTIYVSELFANRVSKVVKGAPVLVANVPSPTALEWAHGRLYVGENTFGNADIATISH